MSLNSLAANRVAREVHATALTQLSAASEDAMGAKGEDVQNALSALVEYVPAETITLYLAAISALPVLSRAIPSLGPAGVYWSLAALTPLLFGAIYAGKRRAAGKPRFPGLQDWPWWPMAAATLAFLAWGLTVPDGPYLDSDDGRVVSGLLAILVSTLLGVGGRFFAPRPE